MKAIRLLADRSRNLIGYEKSVKRAERAAPVVRVNEEKAAGLRKVRLARFSGRFLYAQSLE